MPLQKVVFELNQERAYLSPLILNSSSSIDNPYNCFHILKFSNPNPIIHIVRETHSNSPLHPHRHAMPFILIPCGNTSKRYGNVFAATFAVKLDNDSLKGRKGMTTDPLWKWKENENEWWVDEKKRKWVHKWKDSGCWLILIDVFMLSADRWAFGQAVEMRKCNRFFSLRWFEGRWGRGEMPTTDEW